MMPDREKTRPWLVEQVKQAEIEVAAARKVAGVMGPNAGAILMNKPMGALALAGTVLSLADAEWEREAARAAKHVHVRCEPQQANTETETEHEGDNG